MTRRVSAASADWLLAAVRDVELPGPPVPHESPEDLAWAADVHGVPGWVRRRARAHGVRLPEVEAAVRGGMARHQRALADLRVAVGALGGHGVRALVVKGPALTALYPAPSLRSYVDLDLMVDPRQVPTAVEALQGAGLRVLDANWPLLERLRPHETPMLGPTGGAVDVHWSLTPGPFEPGRPPAFERLWERRREVALDGIEASVLSWPDTLCHVAMHAAADGGHRLVWCTDLRAVLAGWEAAWNDPGPFAAQWWPATAPVATQWGCRPALALMLGRARRALALDLEPGVEAQIHRSALWSGLTRLVDAAFPFERTGTGPSPARAIARACEADTAASVRATLGKGYAVLRGGRLADPHPPELVDPENPDSAFHPVGGRAGQEAYYRGVAERARAVPDDSPPT